MKTILALIITQIAGAASYGQSTRDLRIFVGTWDVEEVHANGWSERGIRSCAYIMDSTYIQCETTATSNGKKRTYRFLINYNSVDKRYDMVGIYSNWSLKQFDVIVPDGSGTKFGIKHAPLLNESTERSGSIDFSSNDEYVWKGENYNPKTKSTTIYTEKGRRRK